MPAFDYAPAPESRSIVDIKPSYGLFVDGEFVGGSGRSFKTVNPATEEVLAEVAEASEADVDLAVRAARRAAGLRSSPSSIGRANRRSRSRAATTAAGP